jgi:hypothetical protein
VDASRLCSDSDDLPADQSPGTQVCVFNLLFWFLSPNTIQGLTSLLNNCQSARQEVRRSKGCAATRKRKWHRPLTLKMKVRGFPCPGQRCKPFSLCMFFVCVDFACKQQEGGRRWHAWCVAAGGCRCRVRRRNVGFAVYTDQMLSRDSFFQGSVFSHGGREKLKGMLSLIFSGLKT